jgi:histone H3/H4
MSIPLAAIERVSRKAGATRISAKAIKELQKALNEISLHLSVDAGRAARHAKRRTILASDIRLVAGKK